ncbi:MAG: D-alanine--D-alanine ligase [Planctomycetota bacterium]|nr:D-alanine--D-alanine ligase [Planctomycetota bacterium]
MSSPRPVIAVLMGGPDGEHQVSLESGASVAQALRDADFGTILEQVIPPTGLVELDSIQADVIFPVLHGPWGEGGPLQELLESDGRPFVGCGALAASAAMDKHHTKQVAQDLGIPTAPWERLDSQSTSTLSPPVVVKPVAEGSSLELHVANTDAERDAAIAHVLNHGDDVLVEQFIDGRELTVGIVGDETLPIIEIQAAEGLYDYQAKYTRNDTVYVINPEIDSIVQEAVCHAALALHHGLGARHLSRVDFLLDHQGPWLLEINTMPGFTSHSLLPKAAAARGWPLPELCRRLVNMALEAPTPSSLKGPGPASR